MKKRSAPKAPSSPVKHITQAIIATVLTMAVVLYNLWFWVIAPQQQHDFAVQVSGNIESARRDTQAYLIRLQQPLNELADTFPKQLLSPAIIEDTFQQDLPVEVSTIEAERIVEEALLKEKVNQQAINTWLVEYQGKQQKNLSTLKTLSLLSVEQVDDFLALSPQTALENNASFIFIDMINRLQKDKPLFVEAAKVPHAQLWELHQVVPIRHQSGQLLAVIHGTFSLDGLKNTFSPAYLSLGELSFIQSIENEQELAFLTLGKASSGFSRKTKTIQNSHWRVAYQPSQTLFEMTHQMPIGFFIVALLIPLFFILLTAYYLRKLHVVSTTDTQKHNKAKGDLERKGETPIAAEDDNVETASIKKGTPEAPTSDTSVHIPDTIFRAYDIRGLAHEEFSCELVVAIGQAFASEVLAAGDKAMIVGYDARIHSLEFSECIMAGIISTGCDVINIGLVPTPLLNFSACEDKETSSGIIITASHNPKEYNGCKMVVKGQTLVDQDIQHLKARIRERDVTFSKTKGKITLRDYSQSYIERISSDLAIIDGWRVVLDAGNGAASELAPRLFEALECDVTPLFCEFDGEFPNHDPDPSVAENLAALVDTVKEKKADIGFAFDGDGDRVMVVTAKGKILWPDQLLMLFAQDVVTRNPGCDVVFDIKSTHLLANIISDNGGRPVMWKTGHSHIKAKMRETNALLGGEFSGHIFFKERWFGFDDGLYAAARLLELMTLTGESIDSLLDKLPSMVSTAEIKVAIAEDKKFTFIEKLVQQANFPNGQCTVIDGLRVDFAEGWGLVRASNTSPVLTLRFQAVSRDELESIKQQFKQELYKIDSALDLSF